MSASGRRVAGFDFFEQAELPAPHVPDADARQLLATHYGLDAAVTSLGSQQDQNFLVRDRDDTIVGVLKIVNPVFTALELQAQDAAAELIAAAEPALRVAVAVPNPLGENYTAVDGLLDSTAFVRLLSYLPGGTLVDTGFLSPTTVAAMGELAGRVSRALVAFTHPGLDRALQWDLRHGLDVVTRLVGHMPSHRDQIAAAAGDAWSRLATLADDLPRQAVHLDLTDANVVRSRATAGADQPDGIIDFGDLSHTWAVSELAVTLSSVLGHPGTGPHIDRPGSQGLSPDSAAVHRGGRCAVATAGAARDGAAGQRGATGRARPRQRLRHRAVRRGVAHLRAGDVGTE